MLFKPGKKNVSYIEIIELMIATLFVGFCDI